MVKKLVAAALVAVALVGCTPSDSGTQAPTPTATPSVSIPTASPTPTQPAVKLSVAKAATKAALKDAGEVYATAIPGPREAKRIEAIANKLEKQTGCEAVYLPAFLSERSAVGFLLQGQQNGYDIDAYVALHVDVQNPKLLRKIGELIEEEYNAKVTVRSAELIVLAVLVNCNIDTGASA